MVQSSAQHNPASWTEHGIYERLVALHPSCGCSGHWALLDAIRLRLYDEAVRLMDEHLWAIEKTLDWSAAEHVAVPFLGLLGLEAMT